MWRDLRYGLRTLGRSPVYTLVAVVSLALGIGANTAIFSLLNQVMFRTLPIADPELLVVLHTEGERQGWTSKDNDESVFSYPMYQHLRDKNQIFDGVIARTATGATVAYGGESEHSSIELVSGNFFDVLGVRPVLGRLLNAEDDVPGARPVAVLPYGYWKRRFGASPTIVGQQLDINQHPVLVAGIVPPGFHGLVSGDDREVFLPVTMRDQIVAGEPRSDNEAFHWLNVFARLKSGITLSGANAGLAVLYRNLSMEEIARMKETRDQRWRDRYLSQKVELRPAAQGINALGSQWATPLIVLMAMVGFVLLIACANVANLLLARAAGRKKEMAIRRALGATRWTIARQVLTESLMVAVAGGAMGLLVADWTMHGLLRFLPEGATGGWLAASLDLRTLGFSLALALVTGAVFGVAPALDSVRESMGLVLKEQAASLASAGGQARLRQAFIVAQVALSLVLLVGSGLFTRSLVHLLTKDPGFHTENLLRFAINPSLNGYDLVRGEAFYRQLQQRLATLPGVRSVGATNFGPFGGGRRGTNITVEGYKAGDDENMDAFLDGASPSYFQAMGIPLVAGREFDERDGAAAPKVVVVSETFTKRFRRAGNLLGKHLAFGAGNHLTFREIVGIVRDVNYGSLREEPDPFIYMPMEQATELDPAMFFVRTARPEKELVPNVRRLLRVMDSNLPLFQVGMVRAQIDDSIYRDRMVAVLSSAFGALATLLAAIGLYGVVAFNVARRTGEMGLRMALGALPRDVLGLVMKEVGLLFAAGSVPGLMAALVLGRYVESELFGMTAKDPVVFGAAIAALAIAALVAGYIPARRAARIDPIRALRYE